MTIVPESVFNLFDEKVLLFVVLTEANAFNLPKFFLKVVNFRKYPVAYQLHIVNIFEFKVLELLYLFLHQVMPFLGRTAVEPRNELL